MAKQEANKWEGEMRVKLKGLTPDQVWPLISDFCSINKLIPDVASCYLVEGVPGQPGMIRYCASTELPGGSGGIQWAKEKLLMIDPSQKCFSYEIVENNAGFKSYLSTVRLEEIESDGSDESGSGCVIVWSFVADPVEGWSFEGLVGFLGFTAQAMAQRLEQALFQT